MRFLEHQRHRAEIASLFFGAASDGRRDLETKYASTDRDGWAVTGNADG